MLTAGIVGLPNVGKSTLFNALTRTRKAEAANYPFCTIDPNVGMVVVPDERLKRLEAIVKPKDQVIPAVIEIVDIAGLVKGASQGEGLGNKFLDNIRKVDAIIQVVRCFQDDDIIHTLDTVDPIRDIEIISTELILSDIQSAQGQFDRLQKKARAGDKDAKEQSALLELLIAHLNDGKLANTLQLNDDDVVKVKAFNLLTMKPVIYACNVAESDLAGGVENDFVKRVAQYAREHHAAKSCIISAKIESELVDLSSEESAEFLKEIGVEDSGVSQLIRATYELLGLASYFTAGEKEVRAWTFVKGMKAPECAGIIHTDFQTGFIKADVVSYHDLDKYGSLHAAREAGKYRLEGKEYLFQDGDVAVFRFNN